VVKHASRIAILPLLAALVLAGVTSSDGPGGAANASPGVTVFREPAYGLPHIYADTDVELARAVGQETAKDRLGQLVLIGRVARGTIYQAFGALDPGTFDDDVAVRRDGYASSELNNMFDKLPADVRALILEYCKGVNDVIDDVYAGAAAQPAEVFLLRNLLGLGNDLFGNATNISDQIDPSYKAPGGADPERPAGGFQFTPEMVMAIAVLQVRNFGSESFGDVSRLDELNSLLSKFPATGDEIWNDLNFRSDPLAPVSVPDNTTPGFGGPLARRTAPDGDSEALATAYPNSDYDEVLDPLRDQHEHREEFARRLGAWPALGSYAWMIDGARSDTDNPWIGGFPQTGIQTPSIMHFIEVRSAEGADHRIQARGMEFMGAPAVLIGETDSVAWTSTTAQLKNNDYFLEQVVLEDANALRYSDEGAPAFMNMRTEQIRNSAGVNTPTIVWRTHERGGNDGSRTVEGFRGDRTGTADSATATSLTDAGGFTGGTYAGGYVAITRGPGSGQIRPILSNTSDTVTLAGGDAWSVTPTSSSQYVAVRPGSDIVALARDRSFWLEESTAALGFSLFQRSEDVLDIRRGARLIPTTHNFISADNQTFNGTGSDLGAEGNTGFYSSGFSRVRQGGSPTDIRLPMDGTQPNELVVVGGSVTGAGADTLASTGAFTGEDFSPPALNYRLDNPSQLGSEYIVTIIAGNGQRQTRRIANNTDDTLTLEEDWGVVPSAGDLFEIYEIVAMPEAINPPQGYTANWNNKAATADDGRDFGRDHRNTFILERLAADSSWTRDEQRTLNDHLAGLDGKGKAGRYLIPRLRQAVDAVGNGGNPQVDIVLAALEAHNASPYFGRGFIDPRTSTMVEGEGIFLGGNPFGPEPTYLIRELAEAIYGDEYSGTVVGVPGDQMALDLVVHAIDSAAGTPSGRYTQAYTGDYFNGADWRVVVRDALAQTITELGGVPADIARPNDNFTHPLSAIYPNLVFDPTPIGNRGTYEQIVEVGPTVRGEMVFPLGQSGFIDSDGLPDAHADTLQLTWRDWRFVPMLHVAEDLSADPDGDVDNDAVLDGFEKWYYGSNSQAPGSDTDSDGLTLLQEYQAASDPTHTDTDGDALSDGTDKCPTAYNPGQADQDVDGIGDDCDHDRDGDACANAREKIGNAVRGGGRDYLNFWDFFDTPTVGAVPLRNKAVDIDDIFNVIPRFATSGAPGDPLSPPPPTGYHSAYDRSFNGPDAWDLGPADGAIGVDEIFWVAGQFGHNCN
jgi:hypothetical protein